MNNIIKNLSNEEYHNAPEYYGYWSSTGLRNYLKSPAEALRIHEEHEKIAETPQLILGSLVHDALEYIHATGDFSLSTWQDGLAVFEPPINPTTGSVFGPTTKKYSDAYAEFVKASEGLRIVSKENLDIAHSIARSVERDSLLSKVIIRGEAEVSHFIEHNGAKYKTRPDLELPKMIFDWKTFGDAFSKDALLRRIVNSGYAIQAAMYQWMAYQQTGVWKTFYMVFLQTVAPYDICIASLNGLAYTVSDGIMVDDQTVGARQFNILRELHERCLQEDIWPGQEIFIKPDDSGRRILEFDVPSWIANSIIEPYYE